MTEVSTRIVLSLRKTAGVFFGLRVKMICVDFLPFVLIFPMLNYFRRFNRWFWRLFVAAFMSQLDEVVAVSSANVTKSPILDCDRYSYCN